MLHTWYSRQENIDDVSHILGEALIKSNLNMIARDVLDYPSGSTRRQSIHREFPPQPSIYSRTKSEQRGLLPYPREILGGKTEHRKVQEDRSRLTRWKSEQKYDAEHPLEQKSVESIMLEYPSGSKRSKSVQREEHPYRSKRGDFEQREYLWYQSGSAERNPEQKRLVNPGESTRPKSEQIKILEHPSRIARSKSEQSEYPRHPSAPGEVELEQRKIRGSTRYT